MKECETKLRTEVSKATSYSQEWLQRDRPQPMYDKAVNKIYRDIFFATPVENSDLIPEFKRQFISMLNSDGLNRWMGLDVFPDVDICIGCTQYIDDLYQVYGASRVQVLAKDYKYHWRLFPERPHLNLSDLQAGVPLIISMPFPFFGDVHPQMSEVLDLCLQKSIPVHIDGAWMTSARLIEFDFSHPAVQSFAVSLSKGYGLGANRIGLRFAKKRWNGPISIMNDFDMNCKTLVHVGSEFMRKLGPNFFWNKYASAYSQICTDFGLKETKSIHIGLDSRGPVGLRPLLRFLMDS